MWASEWAQCWLSRGWVDPLPANAIVSIFNISIYHRRILCHITIQDITCMTGNSSVDSIIRMYRSFNCLKVITIQTRYQRNDPVTNSLHWLIGVYPKNNQCNDLTCWLPWKTRRSDRRQTGTSWQTPDLRSDWFLSLEKSFWWEPAAVLCQS